MHHDGLRPRNLRLFDALLRRANEQEKAALLSIIDEKPLRNDPRNVPRPSPAGQLLELLEFLAANAEDEQSHRDFRAKADSLRARIVTRGAVDMDCARYASAIAAIDAILRRIVRDSGAHFSGILFDHGPPTRSVIPRELVLHAEVYWTSEDSACLRCAGGSHIYTFHFVEVEIETFSDSKRAIPSGREGDIPSEFLERRLRRMTELVEQGMKRQPAARQAINEVPYRDQSNSAAVKRLMRRFGRPATERGRSPHRAHPGRDERQ